MKTGICWNGRKSFGLGPNQNLHRRKQWKYMMLFGADLVIFQPEAPMGSPSRGGGVSRLSLPTPFSPIFVCPSAYRNLSPVLLFTHQLLPTYLQFSSSDCPFCLHRPFTYISLLYKPSFCHFSFSLWSTRDPAR